MSQQDERKQQGGMAGAGGQPGESTRGDASASEGLPGSALSGASVESPQAADGVGRQSGQQREHGHMSREDQERERSARGQGTDRLGGHPDTSSESVRRGVNGGTGTDDNPA